MDGHLEMPIFMTHLDLASQPPGTIGSMLEPKQRNRRASRLLLSKLKSHENMVSGERLMERYGAMVL
jgi:hypothetical protein